MGQVKESIMECNYELLCALSAMFDMANEAYEHTSGIDVTEFNRHFAKAVESGTYWNKGLFSTGSEKE